MMLDIETQKASALASRCITEVNRINREVEGREEWLAEIHRLIVFFQKSGEAMENAKYYALTFVEDQWDSLPLSFRKQYGFDFIVLAEQIIKRDAGTIKNNLRAIRTFLRDEKGPTGMTVTIPVKRDGAPVIDEAGRPQVEVREWNPATVPLSKMAVLRSVAADDKLSPKLAAMAMDEDTTVDDLQVELYSNRNGIEDDGKGSADPELRFGINGNVITVSRLGMSIEIGELYFDVYDTDDLAGDGIRRLARFLGIKMSEIDGLVKAQKRAILASYGVNYEKLLEEGNEADQDAANDILLSQRREQN